MPVPNLLAFRLDCALAHRRVEADKEPPLCEHTAPLEVVAEESEAGVLRLTSTHIILAVDDLRLVGMQFESKGPKPFSECSPQTSGLFLGVAVDDRVIRLCREPDYAENSKNYQYSGL